MAAQLEALVSCHLALSGSWTHRHVSSDDAQSSCLGFFTSSSLEMYMSSSPLAMHSTSPRERSGNHSRALSLRSFIFAHRAAEEDGDISWDGGDGRQEFEGEAGRRVEDAFKRMRYPLYIDSGAAGRYNPLPNAWPNEPMPALREGEGEEGGSSRSRGIFFVHGGTRGRRCVGFVPAHLTAGPKRKRGRCGMGCGHAASHMLWNSHVRCCLESSLCS